MTDTDRAPNKSKKRSSFRLFPKHISSILQRSPSPAPTHSRQPIPTLARPANSSHSDSDSNQTISHPQGPSSSQSNDKHGGLDIEILSSERHKTVIAGIKELLKAIEKSADAFPLLKSPVAAVNACINIYEAVNGNEKDIERLLARFHSLTELLAKRVENDIWPEQTTLPKITEALTEARLELLHMKADGCIAKYAKNATVHEKLQTLSRKIADALQRFQLELGLQQEKMTGEIMKEVVLAQMDISKEAPFTSAIGDTVERRGCTNGTRVDIVRDICQWAKAVDDKSCLFWLYGLAGSGKTTIACTVCEQFRTEGLLASSYFCSIQLDSRQSKLIIPTIARHLACLSRSFAVQLVFQLQKDPTVATARLQEQIEGLLCRPWRASSERRTGLQRPFLVIIDALDECDRGLEFLGILLDAVEKKSLQGLKFLVTSRADPGLIKQWQAKSVEGSQISLHEVPRNQVQMDIYRYLQLELEHLSYDDLLLKSLANQAGELFIVASTLVKFLLPPQGLSLFERTQRLQGILESSPESLKQSSRRIDELYRRILVTALSQDEYLSETEYAMRLRILHTIACTTEPTHTEVVADLSRCDVGTVVAVVESLHSVLFSTKSDPRIRIFHASFYDFLISEGRSSQFYCRTIGMHVFLGVRCVDIMSVGLKFNICGIESSFIPDDQLDPPVDQRVEEKIGKTLAYACQNWWYHLREGREGSWTRKCIEELRRFLKDKVLFWMEAMSLLGELRACKSNLSELKFHASGVNSESDILSYIIAATELVSVLISMPPPKFTTQLYLSIFPLSCEHPAAKHWRTRFHHMPLVLQRQIDGRHHCRQVMHVHSPVNSVCFLSDGKRIVCTSLDESIRILDVESGKEILTLEGHKNWVHSAAFSPDGKQVLSSSHDSTVRILDVESGKEIRTLEGHTGWVHSASFSPDGKHILSSSHDRTVIWDVESGMELRSLNGLFDAVFSPDGKKIVSGSSDKTIRIWDAESGQQLRSLDGHTSTVWSAVFSPDGKQIVSCSSDKTIRIWDVGSGEQLRTLGGHTEFVWSAVFSPDGKKVASGSSDKTVCIWEVESGKKLRTLEGHTDAVSSVTFSSDGKQILSGSYDNTMRIWDAMSDERVQHLDGHTDIVLSASFSPNGKQIVSSSNDHTIRIWDAEFGKEIRSLEGHTHDSHSAALSPDGTQIVLGSWDGTMIIWDLDSGKKLSIMDCHTDVVNSVNFSSDGKQIVSSSNDKTVRTWDVKSGKELRNLEGHTGWAMSAAYSPNGKQIVSGSIDLSIRIWDVESGNELRSLDGHTNWVRSVMFSPDGKQIVSGSRDQSVRIWDTETGQQLQILDGHTGWVRSAVFSSDGKLVVSGSRDQTIRIWDVVSGQQLRILHGHTDRVSSALFSPHGKQILSSSWDTSIRVWDLASIGHSSLPSYESHFSSLLFSPINAQSIPRADTLLLHPNGTSYHLKDDGWLVTSLRETGREVNIVWLPPPLRPFYSYQLRVIGWPGCNRIDFTDCIYGARWTECYKGEQRPESQELIQSSP